MEYQEPTMGSWEYKCTKRLFQIPCIGILKLLELKASEHRIVSTVLKKHEKFLNKNT